MNAASRPTRSPGKRPAITMDIVAPMKVAAILLTAFARAAPRVGCARIATVTAADDAPPAAARTPHRARSPLPAICVARVPIREPVSPCAILRERTIDQVFGRRSHYLSPARNTPRRRPPWDGGSEETLSATRRTVRFAVAAGVFSVTYEL